MIRRKLYCTAGMAVLALGLMLGPPMSPAGPSDASSARGRLPVLITHALRMGIDATSVQLSARWLTSMNAGGDAEPTLKRLRTDARSDYSESRQLLESVREQIRGEGSNHEPFYADVVDYLETLWKLSGEAAPVDQPAQKTEATGELSVEVLATIEVINRAVLGASSGFLLKDLSDRMPPPEGDKAADLLGKQADKMLDASRETSRSFPGVAESKLKQAKAQLSLAKSRLESAKAADSKLKSEAKEAKKEGESDQAKALKKQEKQAAKVEKSQAKAKKEAAKAVEKAKKAEENEFAEDVKPSVEVLTVRAEALIQRLDQMARPSREEGKSKN